MRYGLSSFFLTLLVSSHDTPNWRVLIRAHALALISAEPDFVAGM
jgi:hypothetical protein